MFVLMGAVVGCGRHTLAWTGCAPRQVSKGDRITGSSQSGRTLELRSTMDTSNRRSFTGAAAVFFAALCAGASTASAERPNVLPPVPPKPSKNKVIYDLQVQSWKAEPYDRMRLYLQAVTQRFIQELEASAFGGKYFIHWTAEPDSEEFFKFDVVDRDNYNEAARSGQILIDSDISEPEEGIEVYVYKNAEARAELAKTILIQDLVIVPKELQDAIRVIQATPFPPYEGGTDRYVGLKTIIE